ncbi:hypothetical protein [Streptomyces sp. NPDC049555]|uniref:RICIN domain-containing protein n=1 Tax=unclassified Streptomyces TaxID=2593676 RepID=UPI003436AEB2
MKKPILLSYAIASLAALTVGVATTGPASAQGESLPEPKAVQWKSKKYGDCLARGTQYYVRMGSCSSQSSQWYDQERPDVGGGYIEKDTPRPGGNCLDSNKYGTVYTGPCEGNLNQRWSEWHYDKGWILRNWATKMCLVSDAAGGAHTAPCDADNDAQYWE